MTPTTKVVAGGLGGAVTIILVWCLGLAGIDMPAAVASAITTVVTFAAGYIVKDTAPADNGNAP